MLRVLGSVALVFVLGAAAFVIYAHWFAPHMNGQSSAPTVGAPPAQPVVTPPPAVKEPPVVPPPAPVVQTPPPPRPVTPEVRPAVPYRRTHVVQRGESLSSISRHYYGTPDQYTKIADANNLRSRDLIRVGQLIVIPDGPVASPAPAAPVTETAPETETPTEPRAEVAGTTQQPDFEPMPPTLNAVKKKE
jgi:LysM repeat protein